MEAVVTPQRFAQGLTCAEYLSQIEANQENFAQNEQEFRYNPEDERAFARFNQKLGPIKVLAIAEHWCPDVYRGLPIMARIAEKAGMEIRVFPRDKNLDLMNLYLNQGKYQSIPTFVFFDRDWQSLGHWIERPAVATQIMNQIRAELAQSKLSEEETRAEVRKRVAGLWGQWRQETVRELRDLLAQH